MNTTQGRERQPKGLNCAQVARPASRNWIQGGGRAGVLHSINLALWATRCIAHPSKGASRLPPWGPCAGMALRSAFGLLGLGLAGASLNINIDKTSGPLASLAARELRRYLHAGGLIPSEALSGVFAPSADGEHATVTIATRGQRRSQCSAVDGEHAEGFSITQVGSETCITGYSDAGALQGVYTFLEYLGLYFSSTNPVVPARLGPFPEDGYSVASTPAFTTRGLQPFHGAQW